MQNFVYYAPTEVIFGKDAEAQTAAAVSRWNGSRVLIVYGGGSVRRSGLLQRIQSELDAADIAWTEIGGVQPNPRLSLAEKGVKQALDFNADFILAVGGGSVIDTAKGIAHGTANPDTKLWDIWTGQAPLTKSLPVGVVLTIPAAGSEMSDSAVLTNEEIGRKAGINTPFNRVKFAIMNPELTYTLPRYQVTCGIVDIMMHTLDRYFTHTKDVELTDRLLEAVMLTMIKEGRRVMKNPDDYEARANIMWAAMIAQNNSTGVGRAQDWGTHHMDNEIGILYGASHGAGLALLFPYWMEYAMKTQGTDRFVMYANRVWGCQIDFEHPEVTAREGIKAFQDFMCEIGMPTTISELGGKPEDIPVMVENMFHGAPNHGNFVKLTPEIAAEIYRMAM